MEQIPKQLKIQQALLLETNGPELKIKLINTFRLETRQVSILVEPIHRYLLLELEHS